MYQERIKRIARVTLVAAAVAVSVAGATPAVVSTGPAAVQAAPLPPPPSDPTAHCPQPIPNVPPPPGCTPISSTEYAQAPVPVVAG